MASICSFLLQDMIVLILATDMARHAEILDAFKQKVDNFDFSSEDHLTSLKMILIKACDVSNECRPFMISEHWVECLLEEYFHQVLQKYNKAEAAQNGFPCCIMQKVQGLDKNIEFFSQTRRKKTAYP